MPTWTRERIIRELLLLEAEGRKLSSSRENGVDSRLYQAATRIFGSWRNALVAAGISPERVSFECRWPREKILARIVALSRQRQTMGPSELPRKHHALLKAAERRFGTWTKAVAAAGVKLTVQRRSTRWSRDTIMQAILTRALEGAPLAHRTVRPKSLREAGVRLFGSWQAALAAAGVDRRPGSEDRGIRGDRNAEGRFSRRPTVQLRTGQVWTDESVIDAILLRLRGGKAMNSNAVHDEDRPLYRAAERRFGNWGNALSAAGLNPIEFRKGGGNRKAQD
jgi:hypothetical protein